LIESMERQLEGFEVSGHYYEKYRELEEHMNDYICSTNEAQEEFIKKITLLKGQTTRLEA
jgi:hypothetical protein